MFERIFNLASDAYGFTVHNHDMRLVLYVPGNEAEPGAGEREHGAAAGHDAATTAVDARGHLPPAGGPAPPHTACRPVL